MADNTYRIAFELAGKIDSSYQASFSNGTKKAQELNSAMRDLSKTQAAVGKFRELKSGAADTARKLDEAKLGVNNLAKELKNAQGNTKALAASLEAAKAAENPEEVKRLSKELKTAQQAEKSLTREFDAAKSKAGSLKDKLNSQNEELQRLRGNLGQAGVSTRNLAQDNAKLAQQLEKVAKAQQKEKLAQEAYNRAVSKVQANQQAHAGYKGQMLETAALAYAFAAPINKAMDFQSAMADVNKVVNFETNEQLQQMSNELLRMTRVIPMGADQLANIAAAGGQLIKQRPELVRFTSDAAKMGVAFDIAAEDAGQTMMEWRTAFKMNQTQVVELADKINYLGNTTAASAPKISEVVRRIGPLGKIGGLASGEIAAMGATLVGMGVQDEIASTGIKNLILSMTAGSAATKKQQKAFKAVGLDAKQMAAYMQKDARGAILTFLSAVQKLPQEEQASVLTQIVGKESIAAIAPLLTGMKNLEQNFDKVADKAKYAGSMEQEFATRSNTARNNLQLLANSASEIAVSAGTTVLPALVDLSKKMAEVAQKVAEFTQKHPNLTKAIVYSTAAMIGLKIASVAIGFGFTGLVAPILDVIKVVRGLRAAQTILTAETVAGKLVLYGYKAAQLAVTAATKAWTGVQWLWNAAMSANPIGLVIAGIAGLITAGYLLIRNWEKVKAAVEGAWERFRNNPIGKFLIATNPLLKLLDTIYVKWDLITGGIKKAWDWLTKWNKTDAKDKNIPTTTVSESAATAARTARYGHNATGTTNWKGGPTYANERGGEIFDLPKGTKIIPHDVSNRMVDQLAANVTNNNGGNITYNFYYQPQLAGNAAPETKQVLTDSYLDFIRHITRWMRDQRRIALGPV